MKNGEKYQDMEHMKKTLKIGALVSGSGTNLQAIIDACVRGAIPGEVVFVVSDNHGAYGLKRAQKMGIPAFTVDYDRILKSYPKHPDRFSLPSDWDLEDILRKQVLFSPKTPQKKVEGFFACRVIVEAELFNCMTPFSFDLIVLAGFMRLLTPYFIDRVNIDLEHPRIMNIHPALLPAFPGTDGYGDAFRNGCKVAGCTVHFVDYGEDSGSIIAQRAFAIEEGDTETSVREKGLGIEWELYPYCIALFAQNRLQVIRKKYSLPGGKEMEKSVVRILP